MERNTQDIVRQLESQRTGGTKERIAGALGAAVERGVTIPNRDEVGAYLQQHSELPESLSEYIGLALQTSAPGSELSLELYRDPKVDDEHLVIYIRQRDYSDNLLQRIDRVYEELAGRSEGAESGWIFITTDYFVLSPG